MYSRSLRWPEERKRYMVLRHRTRIWDKAPIRTLNEISNGKCGGVSLENYIVVGGIADTALSAARVQLQENYIAIQYMRCRMFTSGMGCYYPSFSIHRRECSAAVALKHNRYGNRRGMPQETPVFYRWQTNRRSLSTYLHHHHQHLIKLQSAYPSGLTVRIVDFG